MNGPEILHLIRRDLSKHGCPAREAADPSTHGHFALAGDERLAEGHPPGA